MTAKARPILFSGPMVRALLAGTKTQTRRIVKPAPDWERPEPCSRTTAEGWQGPIDRSTWAECADPEMDFRRCPYGGPGDLLVVRETWACHSATNDQRPGDIDRALWSVLYAADGHIRPAAIDGSCALPEQFTKTRVSIHMPRWASRTTLEVTDVRVERLQDISEEDAKAEGITEHPCTGPHRGPDATYWTADGPEPVEPLKRTTPVAAYQALWEHINGADSWAASPWVWVLAFNVHQQNIDAFLSQRGAVMTLRYTAEDREVMSAARQIRAKARKTTVAKSKIVLPPRPKPTQAQKDEAYQACAGVCEMCGQPVPRDGPEVQYDHILARGLFGADTAENLRPLHRVPCHARKTAADISRMAKADRQRAKDEGSKQPKGNLRGPGFRNVHQPMRSR